MYIDDLETYLDGFDGDSPCLLKLVVDISIYVDNVVLLSKSQASLQRLLNKLFKFCTSYGESCQFRLDHNRDLRPQHNDIKPKGNLPSQGPKLRYKYLGIDFYSNDYFEPSSKM